MASARLAAPHPSGPTSTRATSGWLEAMAVNAATRVG